MVDTNDKGTESDEDEQVLEAFSLSSKDLATPAAGVGLKHLLPTIADGSRASKALEMDEGDSTGSGEQHFQLEEETPTDGIPDIVNSTELRSIVDAAELVEVPDGSGVWRLSRSAEEEALSWCR